MACFLAEEADALAEFAKRRLGHLDIWVSLSMALLIYVSQAKALMDLSSI